MEFIIIGIVAFLSGIVLTRWLTVCRCHSFGGKIMFVVKDNNPDVAYQITAPTVTDAEGFPVDAGTLKFIVKSDNEAAVAVTPNEDGLSGTAKFGSPNADGSPAQANVTVEVRNSADAVLGVFGAQFSVTAGDAAAIVGGKIDFAGLTES